MNPETHDMALPKNEETRRRVYTMDEIRGFAVMCMVVYHTLYDLAILFKNPVGKTLMDFFTPASPFFAGLFILISGISSRLSRSNVKRGAKLFAVACGFTAVTLLIDIVLGLGVTIWFGILHLLSVCMLLFALTEKLWDKIHPTIMITVFGALTVLALIYGSHGFRIDSTPLGTGNLLAFLNIRDHTFYSVDFYPLIPWAFVFFAGTTLGVYAKAGKFPKWMYKSRIPFLQWIGRRALLIYIVHQPVMYGIIWLMSVIITGESTV